MRLCLPARMGGGGKAESTPWRGPAGAQRPPHGGGYSASGNERAKPLAFPHKQKQRRSASPLPQRGIQTAPSHGATQTGSVAASEAGARLLSQRVSAASPAKARPSPDRQGEKRECQRVSQRTPHPQGAQRERVRPQKIPRIWRHLPLHAPDRYPDGPGLKARCAWAHRAGCR